MPGPGFVTMEFQGQAGRHGGVLYQGLAAQAVISCSRGERKFGGVIVYESESSSKPLLGTFDFLVNEKKMPQCTLQIASKFTFLLASLSRSHYA